MRIYLKDWVTAGNLLAGFAAAVFAMRGELMWAALMMPVAMFFDAFDGIVARLTKRYNKFGGELDNVCDHMSYGVAPGFMLYAAYEPVFRHELQLPALGAAALAFAVGSVPLVAASLRFARFNTYHYDTPGYWLGVARPVTGFALAALVNSHLFSVGLAGRMVGLGLVLAFGVLNVSTFPYPNHHSPGRSPKIYWFYYFLFVGLTLVTILLGPVLGLVPYQYVGDVILFTMGSYAFLGWMEVPVSARRTTEAAVTRAELQVEGQAITDTTVRASAPVTPSLPPRVAAGLAYVLGPLTGLYVLRRQAGADKYVGFHAWQAIFSVLAIGFPYFFLFEVGGMVAHLAPSVDLVGLLWWPMAVFFTLYWLALLVGAFAGRKWYAPFIGWAADKQLA
ncbi:MAG: CDP-alcohol phosphatidyltransferase family protein [Deltaproteobacteria bacterium]|nr:CDP-alcohol phosphatidyltransferase family protein [Deltaproteobacteria bacterium]